MLVACLRTIAWPCVPRSASRRWKASAPSSRGGGGEKQLDEAFGALGIRPDVLFLARDNSTIFGMVREGIGLTVMPELTIPDDITGLAVRRRDTDPAPRPARIRPQGRPERRLVRPSSTCCRWAMRTPWDRRLSSRLLHRQGWHRTRNAGMIMVSMETLKTMVHRCLNETE